MMVYLHKNSRKAQTLVSQPGSDVRQVDDRCDDSKAAIYIQIHEFCITDDEFCFQK